VPHKGKGKGLCFYGLRTQVKRRVDAFVRGHTRDMPRAPQVAANAGRPRQKLEFRYEEYCFWGFSRDSHPGELSPLRRQGKTKDKCRIFGWRGRMAEFRSLAQQGLHGKVVLVTFWTYS
jgi:hypothetical protein